MAGKPINIHGKEYRTVAQRIGILNDLHPLNYSLVQDTIKNEGDIIIIKSVLTIHSQDGDRTYTGMAEEDRSRGQINKTSALENCETSAIGRALAAAGLGGEEYASANEVENAIHQQQTRPAAASGVLDKLADAKGKERLIRRIIDGEEYLATQHDRSDSEAMNSREKHLRTKVLEKASIDDLTKFLSHIGAKAKGANNTAAKAVAAALDGDIVTAVN